MLQPTQAKIITMKIKHLAPLIYLMLSCGNNHQAKALPDNKHITKEIQDENELCRIQYIKIDTTYIRDGDFKCFYKSGELKTEGSFKDDVIDGPLIDYFQNGAILNRFNFVRGALMGSQYTYFANGVINTFKSIIRPKLPDDNSTDGIFEISYNTSGEIESVHGDAFISSSQKDERIYIKNDTAALSFFMAEPPKKYSASLTITTKSQNHQHTDTLTQFDFKDFFGLHLADYNYHCSRGTAKYIAICKWIDNSSKKVIVCDTISGVINVQ
jgi:hypothetical protein